jgi:CheY-like chemotaxis protein/two-component sensor histidine kinase
MLAHELRNPLAPIVHAGSLLRRAQGQDPKVIERSAEIIVRQSAHMTRLIEDLLDVARITRGKVTLQRRRVALQVVAESAAETARPAMEARRHEFHVSLPHEAVDVDGDPARLAQIISNLLQNSARYTDPGGRVELTVERAPDAAVLSVRDTGIGIPPELLPSIFELFSQAERDLDRASGGLGIGLTVARSLVEMHGGTIEARSEGSGQGSEFIVRLPLREDPHHHHPREDKSDAEPLVEHSAHHSTRVLIIEDNEDASEVLVELLKQWGHEVRASSDGASALIAARQFQPELVLLDIGLPGMNGYDVALELRRIPGVKDALLVAMTGYGQSEDQERSRAAGVDLHLVKPVAVDVLENVLRERRN